MTEQSPHAPLAPTRRAHVLAAIARDGIVRVSQLIDELGVTPVTVRRDLVQLEQEGLRGARARRGGRPPGNGHAAPGARQSDHEQGDSRSDRDAELADSIAVLVPSLNYYWPHVVRGMEQEARRLGYRLLLRGASYELQDERPVLERLVHYEGVKGLIVAPNTDTPHAQDVIQWLAGCGVPSVLTEREAIVLPERVPVESVATDHALGALLAARHLAELGHQKVGLVLLARLPHVAQDRGGMGGRLRRARSHADAALRAVPSGARQRGLLGCGQRSRSTAPCRAAPPRCSSTPTPRPWRSSTSLWPADLGAGRPLDGRVRRRGRRALHARR